LKSLYYDARSEKHQIVQYLVRLDVFNTWKLSESCCDWSSVSTSWCRTSRGALTLCYSEVLGALLDFDPFEVNQIGYIKSSRKGKS